LISLWKSIHRGSKPSAERLNADRGTFGLAFAVSQSS
jgi:hypothetical protein